jgi:hypothetical protein
MVAAPKQPMLAAVSIVAEQGVSAAWGAPRGGWEREGGAPDVQAAMSPVRAVSGGRGVVPDTVTGRALRSQVRNGTPMLPSASRRMSGNRHPSAAPHLQPRTQRE